MWYLNKIPKLLHLYWGGDRLSYLRYLTVKTFRDLNPDWQVRLHVPRVLSRAQPAWDTFQQKNQAVSKDYMDRVDVEICDHDFRDLGFDNHAHEVHKSDFLRWYLLSHYGGVWSDMDIVWTRALTQLKLNRAINQHIDTVLCPLMPPRKHTVGFLMASQHNSFAAWMQEVSRSCYDPAVYQCMGSDILNQRFSSLESFGDQFPAQKFAFLDRDAVYAVTSKDIDRFFRSMDAGSRKKLRNSGAVGFHWFGGHPSSQQFEAELTEHNVAQFDTFLANIIQKALT